MKPLKLVMNAFGPYAGKQEVDFTRFDGHNIFVITGPTGAGKTTIFDAVSFALFGDSSGDARESENFKSDYAPPEAVCSVELTFLLKGKEYRIERYPKQTRLSSRGNLRAINSDALLTLPDGTPVSGVRNVDPLIIDLLGISRDRFKQIAMLPQGEYKKLLYADSREKQEIFRKVFSTQIYMQVTDALREQVRGLEDYLGEKQRDLKLNLSMYKPGGEELETLIAAPEQDIVHIFDSMERELVLDRQLSKELETDSQAFAAKIQALGLPEAVRLNTRFDLQNMLSAKLARLVEKKKEAEELEQLLIRLDRTKELQFFKQELEELTNGLTGQKEQIKRTKELLNDLFAKTKELELSYQKLPELQAKRDSISALAASLEQETHTVNLLEQAKQQLAGLRAGEKKLQNREKIFALLFNRKQALDCLDRLNTLQQLCLQLLREVEKFWEASMEYEQARQEYDSAYTAFLQGQAGIIAATLQEGVACPVCGSVHHPAPAQVQGDTPGEGELKNKKQRMDDCTHSLRETDTRARILLEKLYAAWDREEEPGIPKERLYQSKTRLQALKNTFAKEGEQTLAKANELQQELLHFPGITTEVLRDPRYREESFLEQMKEKNVQDLLTQSSKISAVKERVGTLTGQLKNGILSSGELEEKIKAARKEEKAASGKIQEISEAYHEGKMALARAQEDLRGKNQRIAEDEKKLLQKEKEFSLHLSKTGFSSEQEFLEMVSQLNRESDIKKRLSQYREDYSNCESQLAMLKEELNGRQRQDIEALKAQEQILKQQAEQCGDKLNTLCAKILSNEEHFCRAKEIYRQIGDKQEEYARTARLYRLANGNNDAKVDFERYVLAAYFDDIIEASNQRLAKMTGYRYALKRKLERGKYAKASGLDFEIIDSYTGKARDITTLSGGESFQASLALALGVADVMQMYSGGIEMNTMFIDEGFGTLDSQSLDDAIRTLTELTAEDRLIGVISHVSELKERIAAQIEVTSSRAGSHLQVIV